MVGAVGGKQREATVDYYRNSIALAKALGAGQVVLGAAGACWDIEPEALRQNAAEVLEALCPAAEAAGITLLLAPVMGPDTPLIAESPVLGRAEELAQLLRRGDRPRSAPRPAAAGSPGNSPGRSAGNAGSY